MKTDFQIGIVGAGFSGLIAALRLKKSGKNSFVIFERAAEVGGTWRDNTYPGCACDVASHAYSFSDELNPDWNQMYSPQPEILDYMKNVTDKNDLRKHIRFNTDIVESRFLPEQACWKVTDREGNSFTVKVLLLGLGPLNRPFTPDFEGIEDFEGQICHTARWDENFDYNGKKIAIIGTGASAAQVIPTIAPDVEKLTVLQRSAAWVFPRFDSKTSSFVKGLYRYVPGLLRARREFSYWLGEMLGFGFIGNKLMHNFLYTVGSTHLRLIVKDPETRRKLTPDYTIGCKRIMRSDDYLPTFNRKNVQLVTDGIKRFTKNGIVTADGTEHHVDGLVLATGFKSADMNFEANIIGADGSKLTDKWKQKGVEAYYGMTVSGYPNLSFILGPNTVLGHNSVLHMMESQMNYLMQYIDHVLQSDVALDLKEEVQKAFNEELQEKFKNTVWLAGCKSWYLDENGRNTTLYPGLTVTFRKKTRKFNPEIYRPLKPEVKPQEVQPLALQD
jgi:cation diffusion facilitator CzcD-associated flavoprotein CzcO